ncbi:mechanosensitive ion channel family protein [Aquiflexum sp.]|uniref:mechanosensitive ion channel family protein n=1 Tax=Aquiflexum sp. TaxID=1872584 RepID=UPI0035936EBA
MKHYKLVLSAIVTIIFILVKPTITYFFDISNRSLSILYKYSSILVIISFTWFLIQLIKTLKATYLKRYDIEEEDNLASRKVYTQINILTRVVIFVIVLFGVGMVLLSFESIRKVGIGLFASAGVAGIIIGFSAQKAVGTLLAGIQIAITQPFRIDDAVLVENEWGWIEEITLTFVVVRIWDKRRLVLPTTYFLEKPFQNWTRTSADIIGSIFLYTDYTISIQALRDELTRLLNDTPLWDKKVNVLQVTDSKETTMELRILVSAKNSPTTWDLRVHIREKMIEFIQKNYPESLPKTRVVFENGKSNPTKLEG